MENIIRSEKKDNSANRFDNTELVRTKIVPVVEELKKQCALVSVPFFVCVGIRNDESHTEYLYECLSPEGLDKSISNNIFNRFINVALGAKTVQPETPTDDAEDDFEPTVPTLHLEEEKR